MNPKITGKGSAVLTPADSPENLAILALRAKEFLSPPTTKALGHRGPKIGDWVRFTGGEMRRISHVWDCYDDPKDWEIQTSKSGSNHLFGPSMDHSGGLDYPVKFGTFKWTGELRMGTCWFFDGGHARAYAAIQAEIPCPVWECSEVAP